MKLDKYLVNYKLVEKKINEKCPNWTWEDVAMWMQTPKDFLSGRSPIMECCSSDISLLLKWIEDRKNENDFVGSFDLDLKKVGKK